MKAPTKAISRMIAMPDVNGWPATQQRSSRPIMVYNTPTPDMPSTAFDHVGILKLCLEATARKYEKRAKTTALLRNWMPRMNHCRAFSASPDLAPMFTNACMV